MSDPGGRCAPERDFPALLCRGTPGRRKERAELSATSSGVSEPEEWLNFEGTPVEYENGINLNGIAATGDGRYLITLQSNTGKLYRIDTESKEVIEINLGGETFTNGDGILLDGQTLYVVRNQQGLIVPFELSEDFTSGKVGGSFSDSSLHYRLP